MDQKRLKSLQRLLLVRQQQRQAAQAKVAASARDAAERHAGYENGIRLLNDPTTLRGFEAFVHRHLVRKAGEAEASRAVLASQKQRALAAARSEKIAELHYHDELQSHARKQQRIETDALLETYLQASDKPKRP